MSFGTFEYGKAILRRHGGYEHNGELPVVQKLLAGGVAGIMAQGSCYPLHVVRRRMQVLGTGTY